MTSVPVKVTDDRGEQIGIAFPERGVVFSLDKKNEKIAQVLIEPLSPELFLLRAEERMMTEPRAQLLDIELSLVVQPEYAPSYALQSRLLRVLATGPKRRTRSSTLWKKNHRIRSIF